MAWPIRSFGTSLVAMTANVEAYWEVPVDCVYIDILPDNSGDAGVDNRMSFVSGGTANGQAYSKLSPDWWSPEGTKMIAGTRVYLRSNGNTTFRVLYGIGG